MKILIGTPIHVSKDYSMKRWLKNVAELTYQTPADLLLVDNSPNLNYSKKVNSYLKKCPTLNYKIKHLSLSQDLSTDLKIEASQETIRQYVLYHNYDAWFSWECDQLIPANALHKLTKIISERKIGMVIHNSWARWDSTILNTNMGVTLIKKETLKKTWFLPNKNGKISLDPKDSYDINDPTIIKKRILRAGGSYIEVYGVIEPIYHLNT